MRAFPRFGPQGDLCGGRPAGPEGRDAPASHAPKGRGGFSPRPFGALRGMPRPRAPAAQVPFMRGYEIVEPLKGPCRIVWDAIAGFPALADLLHGRGSRSADGRISCARGPAGGSVPLAGLSMSSGRPSPCGRASGFLSRRGGDGGLAARPSVWALSRFGETPICERQLFGILQGVLDFVRLRL